VGKIKAKYVGGGVLIAAGIALALTGVTTGNQHGINAGIGGIFLGVVLLTFSNPDYIKYDAYRAVVKPYSELTASLVSSLQLEGGSVYIPPYENMGQGGIFLPLHRDFDMDLARLDSGTMFLTEGGREKEMGLLFPPLGRELVEMYEGYSESDLQYSGLPVVEDASSSVLKSLKLAGSVRIEEKSGELNVFVEGVGQEGCSESCVQAPCPLCSSILLSIAKATGELIKVEVLNYSDNFVEIRGRKIGGVRKWM